MPTNSIYIGRVVFQADAFSPLWFGPLDTLVTINQ